MISVMPMNNLHTNYEKYVQKICQQLSDFLQKLIK